MEIGIKNYNVNWVGSPPREATPPCVTAHNWQEASRPKVGDEFSIRGGQSPTVYRLAPTLSFSAGKGI